jgi:glycogen operon protein
MALLMLSAGVPMITGGDESGRSVNCNNNAYNIDSVANWLDPAATASHADQVTYFQHLIAFRKAHPALRPGHFRDGTDHNANGMKDETWLTATGATASSEYLSNTANRFLGLWLDGTEANDPSPALYIAYNESDQNTSITLPAVPSGRLWARVADTGGSADLVNFAPLGAESPWPSTAYAMKPRSVVVFVER